MTSPLFTSTLTSLPLLQRGKVRDIYQVDDAHLLIVTTDRLSAFDVVLPTPVPDKGATLTSLSSFWFERTRHIVPNHLTGISAESVVRGETDLEQVRGRAVVVRRLAPLPIEAIVRGYLVGSGWKDYQRSGMLCGIVLPTGLHEAERLPAPLFTPSSKAEVGAHDMNIGLDEAAQLLGEERAKQVASISIALYQHAADYALSRGIIIADTKFEFGLDVDGSVVLIDEALTPDSSRFWPVEDYRPGSNPPSYDKQFVRDYLDSIAWDKRPPAPELPADIVTLTAEKYRRALQQLTQ